jgi:hypothetical protein
MDTEVKHQTICHEYPKRQPMQSHHITRTKSNISTDFVTPSVHYFLMLPPPGRFYASRNVHQLNDHVDNTISPDLMTSS